jgi:PAS domain-containing protein
MQLLSKTVSPNSSGGDLDPQMLDEEQQQMFAEAVAWDAQDMQGILQISFDVKTHQRTHVMVNSRFAQLHGYHKEELLSRLESHDFEFHRTDLDLLISWLHSSSTSCPQTIPVSLSLKSWGGRFPQFAFTLALQQQQLFLTN